MTHAVVVFVDSLREALRSLLRVRPDRLRTGGIGHCARRCA